MNARRWCSGICLGVCVAGAIWWGFAREPRYDGKPLSYWAARACVGDVGVPPEDAVLALRAIGNKGLPFMLRWIVPRAEPPPTLFYLRLVWSRIFGPRPSPDIAIAAFRVMGPQAKPAIPTLTKLLNQSRHFGTSYHAEQALAAIGPDAVPALTGGLTAAHPQVRGAILRDLGYLGTNSVQAIPKILEFANRPDEGLRGEALAALGLISRNPKEIIPLIRGGLTDADATVRARAAMALGDFGKEAAVAVPDLVSALDDPDWMVRLGAIGSLGQIDGSDNVVALAARSCTDSNRNVRRFVTLVLGKVGSEAARNQLLKMTNDPDASVRTAAVEALSRLQNHVAEGSYGNVRTR